MIKKVALIAPILTHYRIRFYEKLSSQLEGRIVFYFQNKLINDGRPGMTVNESEFYNNYSIRSISFASIKLSFSLDLIRKIRRGGSRIIILEGASSNLTSWYFIIFKKLLGLKIISWACGWQPDIKNPEIRKFKTFIERLFFKKVDFIICYSTTASQYFRKIGISTPMKIAYNGIDTEDYYEMSQTVIPSDSAIKTKDKRMTFLYVGGLFKEKQVDFLIECFKILREAVSEICLWIIGDGPMKAELEMMVDSNNTKDILFFGRIEKGVEQYFAAADFFVLPGVGGLALNQAMLWGTPCIVSEGDGTENDLVHDNITGYRFEKNNKRSLIGAMKKAILLSKEDRDEMSKRAQEMILTRSNTDEMVKTFSDIIHNLS